MKVLVCGSRDWTDEQRIADTLMGLTAEHHVEIIHGDARGADRIAARIASHLEFDVLRGSAERRGRTQHCQYLLTLPIPLDILCL